MIKVLNNYAGLGGNRELWENVEVTAVENNPEICEIYKNRFRDDIVICNDAHEFLLNSYSQFDIIWSSTPCPTHSRARFWGWSKQNPVYPDLRLYQEYIFLKHHFNGKFIIENVIPYYEPLIRPTAKIGRHLFWSNFRIGNFEHKSSDIRKLSGTSKRDKLERNKVDSEIGLYILNCAKNIITKQNEKQIHLFE